MGLSLLEGNGNELELCTKIIFFFFFLKKYSNNLLRKKISHLKTMSKLVSYCDFIKIRKFKIVIIKYGFRLKVKTAVDDYNFKIFENHNHQPWILILNLKSYTLIRVIIF